MGPQAPGCLDLKVIKAIINLAKQSHTNTPAHTSQKYWLVCARCGCTKGAHFAGFCKIQALTDEGAYDRFKIEHGKSIIATAIYILYGGRMP